MSDTHQKEMQPHITMSSQESCTSSERKELKLVQMRRVEIEKQNDLEYRIAEQKLQA